MSNIQLEEIELPSRGLVYPSESPLSSGIVEMKYMTAKEEDILTNQSLIAKGTVLDKLLESLTLNKIKINDLVQGDKNALLVGARILGYGSKYNFYWGGVEQECDLNVLENKPFEPIGQVKPNEFKFLLPICNQEITYKLLTGTDEYNIKREIEGLKKIAKESSAELSTRLKFQIVSVGDSVDQKTIREFVDNMRVLDSKALRDHIKHTQPNVDLKIILEDEQEIELPITVGFFWPD